MRANRTTLAPLLAFLLISCGMALPATAQVRDEADFFSADAERQASFDIRDIRQRFGVDLLVDTVPAIPAELQAEYQRLGKDKFFEQWAQQRGREAGLNGVIVLVAKDPSYLRVLPGRQTRQKAFTSTDSDSLRDVLVTAFKAKQYDAGLLQAVATFRKTLQQNLGDGAMAQQPVERQDQGRVPTDRDDRATAPPAAPDSDARTGGGSPAPAHGWSMSTIIIWAVLIFGGIWLIKRLVASRARPAPGPGGYDRGYPGQPQHAGYDPRYGDPGYRRGGGFGSGMGGGLLGGLLGGWLGGHIFRGGGGGGQAYGGGNANAGGSAGHLPQQDPGAFAGDNDRELAGSGGSFASDDFSGGGGGDFGGNAGGDAGSGGDF